MGLLCGSVATPCMRPSSLSRSFSSLNFFYHPTNSRGNDITHPSDMTTLDDVADNTAQVWESGIVLEVQWVFRWSYALESTYLDYYKTIFLKATCKMYIDYCMKSHGKAGGAHKHGGVLYPALGRVWEPLRLLISREIRFLKLGWRDCLWCHNSSERLLQIVRTTCTKSLSYKSLWVGKTPK